MGVTLDQLLQSRDNRQAMERQLIGEHPGLTLIVMTVVMPGAEKRNDNSLIVAKAGVRAVHDAFNGFISYALERDLDTGYEAFFMVDDSPEAAKRVACDIEDSHALGRLFDIDVFDAAARPLSRTMVGRQPRRCLICGEEARVCMRTRKHSYTELDARINQLIADYVRGI